MRSENPWMRIGQLVGLIMIIPIAMIGCKYNTASTGVPNPASSTSDELKDNFIFNNLPAMPTPRSCIGGAANSNKLFVAGGCSGATRYGSSSVVSYDFSRKKWEQMANMNFSRAYPQAAVVNDKPYIMGGLINGHQTASVEVYDSDKNSWINKTAGPLGTTSPSAVAVGSYIYLMGGCNQGNTVHVLRYDTVNDQWATLTGLSGIQLCHPASVAYEGNVYLVGGYNGSQGGSNGFYKYSPSSDSWEILIPASVSREGAIAQVIGTKMYVMGGNKDQGVEFEYYDFSTNSWTSGLEAPRYFRYSVSGVHNSKIYIAGGIYGGGSADLDMLLEFTDKAKK